MGQVRHGSATTTHRVRAAIQRSPASLSQLSRELGINPKTVAKWWKRETVEDMKTGPTEPRSNVLTEAEEAMVVAFRRAYGLATADTRSGDASRRSCASPHGFPGCRAVVHAAPPSDRH